jgi:hypothetical protein
MKKSISIIVAISVALLLFSTNISAGGYGMAGCGLGSMFIQTNDGSQIFAATSNGTAGNQTFGITSGTSNCTKDGIVMNEKKQEVFVHLNYNSLEKEMALGKGEKLSALASLLGCTKDVKGFNNFTKNNFAKLTKDSDPSAFLTSLKAEIQKDSNLKSSCTL